MAANKNRNKTEATGASVEDYIASRASEQQYDDCQALGEACRRLARGLQERT